MFLLVLLCFGVLVFVLYRYTHIHVIVFLLVCVISTCNIERRLNPVFFNYSNEFLNLLKAGFILFFTQHAPWIWSSLWEFPVLYRKFKIRVTVERTLSLTFKYRWLFSLYTFYLLIQCFLNQYQIVTGVRQSYLCFNFFL